ncbi:MAG: GNAT family N-acetyltransferase [Rhodospirillaceae bacterium]|nr:GNAT family N-acetyltransferase [Rhodospirillaceae bacterium]
MAAETFAPQAPVFARQLRWRSLRGFARLGAGRLARSAMHGAFAGAALIGFSRAFVGRFGEVSDLWIDRAWRNRGIGRRLLKTAETWLRRRGTRTARLYTPRFNGGAIRLYRACGWRVELRNRHRSLHVGRVRMCKRLR